MVGMWWIDGRRGFATGNRASSNQPPMLMQNRPKMPQATVGGVTAGGAGIGAAGSDFLEFLPLSTCMGRFFG